MPEENLFLSVQRCRWLVDRQCSTVSAQAKGGSYYFEQAVQHCQWLGSVGFRAVGLVEQVGLEFVSSLQFEQVLEQKWGKLSSH